MAEGKTGSGSAGGSGSAVAGLLREAGRRLVPIVVSTGSLLTFVAFAGSVIVWTRLNAVEVAPDQAITAFPRGELVSIGASLLLLYGFFGALAVLFAFLVDRGGRPTQGMAYALLFLVLVEGVATISLAAEFGSSSWGVAILEFVFAVGFAIWATGLGRFSELRDELHSRTLETEEPRRRWSVLRPKPHYLAAVEEDGKEAVEDEEVEDEPGDEKERREQAEARGGYAIVVSCWSAVGGAFVAVLLFATGVPDPKRLVEVGLFALLFLGTTVLAVRWDLRATRWRRDRDRCAEEEETRDLARKEQAVEKMALESRREDREKTEERRRADRRSIEDQRLGRRRPYRLYLIWPGIGTVLGALALAAVLPALQLGEVWVGVALFSAVAISAWLWRIAIFTRDKIIWFGLAVFLSVPLFGTLLTMARNIDDPQIQPIALIRSSDRPDEAIHGLYVTEAENRVYFASVATEGCTGSLRENSGRLLWVPKDEVVAMSIGPLQSVQSAAKTSLEMAFALTPAVETPAGDSVSLTSGEARSKEGDLGEEAPLHVQRLENVGPAVRPTFGRGLELEPEDAQPGETVTLKMSTPIKDGFGARREGRNLRIGGTPAEIAIDPTPEAYRAEYAKVEGGGRLALEKEGGLYVAAGGSAEIVRYEGQSDVEAWFLKLAGDSGVAETDHEQGGDLFLEISQRTEEDLLRTRKVVDEDGHTLRLSQELERQAWDKDEIEFRVPEKGSTGAVTVDCEQLAGQPLLRVTRAPAARLSVRMAAGSQKVAFDSSHSRDVDGEKDEDGKRTRGLTRSWTIAGRHTGNRKKVSVDLPQRLAPYAAKLKVTDADGQSDTVGVRLFRLPRSFFDFGEDRLSSGMAKRQLRRVRRKVRRAVRKRAPAAIALHGHTDAVGSDEYNAGLSRRRVENLRAEVFKSRDDEKSGKRQDLVPMIVRAFGESCPVDRGGGRSKRNRRVEIFLLDRGARVTTQKGCKARYVRRTSW